ncbi:uncharacterized protein OCT59_004927 [Rhizophagus irregularis]|uniref:uncharacterized protein n=1 Tax=Rhizophagus irregularis TaxID=588596 RepID=UPI00331A9CBE|nr:hypothetical protein OCT59_004927 [Rhizophagus irregularis]
MLSETFNSIYRRHYVRAIHQLEPFTKSYSNRISKEKEYFIHGSNLRQVMDVTCLHGKKSKSITNAIIRIKSLHGSWNLKKTIFSATTEDYQNRFVTTSYSTSKPQITQIKIQQKLYFRQMNGLIMGNLYHKTPQVICQSHI